MIEKEEGDLRLRSLHEGEAGRKRIRMEEAAANMDFYVMNKKIYIFT